MRLKGEEPAQRLCGLRLLALALAGAAFLSIGLGHPSALAASGAPTRVLVANRNCSGVTSYLAGANGDVPPITGGGLCGPFAVRLDSAGNIYVLDQTYAAVRVYPPGSKGQARPSAIIRGSNTGISQPYGMTLDRSNNIYVTNFDNNSVTIYAPKSNGNVTPFATIGGPDTLLNGPVGIGLDSKGNIYVANSFGGNNSVTVYPALSNGDALPIRIIQGPKTGFTNIYGVAL